MEIVQWFDRSLLHLATSAGGADALRDQIVFFTAEILPWSFVLIGIWLFVSGKTKKQHEQNQQLVILVLLAVLIEVAIRWLIAGYFDRPRPFITYPELHHVDLWVNSSSFPSGHAFTLFTAAGVVFFSGFHRRVGILMLIIATLVVLARVVAGAHYPTDIIGGAFLGLLLARIIVWQSDWVEERR